MLHKDLSRIRGQELKRACEEARVEAIREFELLKYEPLFIAGLMLYWGEGDKVTRHRVRLTNTDPQMIKLFARFLVIICNISFERMQAQLLLYPDLSDTELKKYWSDATELPESSFRKTTIIQGRHPTKRLEQGICIILVSSVYLKIKILEWIHLSAKQLIDDKGCENI